MRQEPTIKDTPMVQQTDTGLIEHAMGQLENPHPLTTHVIEIVMRSLGNIFDDEGDLTTEARDRINAMAELIYRRAPADALNDAINAAVATICDALPYGAHLSLSIREAGGFSCTIHKGADWLFEQGATAGEWYGFDDKGKCQRNLLLEIDGDSGSPACLEGIQTNAEAGLSLDECRAQSAACGGTRANE